MVKLTNSTAIAALRNLPFEEYYKDPAFYKAYAEGRWMYYGVSDQQNDWSFFGDLLSQYSQKRRRDTSVLDLGCGYGRIIGPLRELGFLVDGVDLAPSMSCYANNIAVGHGSCVSANICCDDLPDIYDAMVASFDLFNHLQVEELKSALNNCRKYLKREGLLVIDVINPNPRLMTSICVEYQKPALDSIFVNPCTGNRNVVLQKRRYEYNTQKLSLEKNFLAEDKQESKTIDLSFYVYFPNELTTYIESAGYRVERFYGGFSGEELAPHSQKMLLVCKKA